MCGFPANHGASSRFSCARVSRHSLRAMMLWFRRRQRVARSVADRLAAYTRCLIIAAPRVVEVPYASEPEGVLHCFAARTGNSDGVHRCARHALLALLLQARCRARTLDATPPARETASVFRQAFYRQRAREGACRPMIFAAAQNAAFITHAGEVLFCSAMALCGVIHAAECPARRLFRLAQCG